MTIETVTKILMSSIFFCYFVFFYNLINLKIIFSVHFLNLVHISLALP